MKKQKNLKKNSVIVVLKDGSSFFSNWSWNRNYWKTAIDTTIHPIWKSNKLIKNIKLK